LLVTSNPILLTIVDDPGWSHSVALAYADAYEKLCRGEDVAEHNFLQCSYVGQRITYLDTLDSLATEVKMFDGRNHSWDNGFWDAILDSSYPHEAVRLMSSRIQERDFAVSSYVLEWVASSELRMELPGAFNSGTPALYHPQAVEKLRKYVRMLGSSLSQKDSNALVESLKTYQTYAEQEYCESQSLIPAQEQKQVLAGVEIHP
jgi:hypothetical protein